MLAAGLFAVVKVMIRQGVIHEQMHKKIISGYKDKHILMNTSIHTDIHTSTHTHTHSHMHTHMYMYIYMYSHKQTHIPKTKYFSTFFEVRKED